MPRSRLHSAIVLVLILGAAAFALAPLDSPPVTSPASPSPSLEHAEADCLAPIRDQIEDALLGSGFDADAVKRSYLGDDGARDGAELSDDARAELDAIRAAFQPSIDERADALIAALRDAIRAALDGDRVTCAEVGASAADVVHERAASAARRGELSYYRAIALHGRCIEISLLGRDAPALADALRDVRALQAERSVELARCTTAAR